MRVLYFASGTPPKARRALDYLARRFPDAQLDIALCPELEPLLTPAELARVVYRAGTGQPRVGFLRHARRQRYDRVAVLFGGDRGYVTMKLAPFVTAPRHPIICVNEADGAFEWRWANRGSDCALPPRAPSRSKARSGSSEQPWARSWAWWSSRVAWLSAVCGLVGRVQSDPASPGLKVAGATRDRRPCDAP